MVISHSDGLDDAGTTSLTGLDILKGVKKNVKSNFIFIGSEFRLQRSFLLMIFHTL